MAGSGILANIVSELLKNLGSKALEEIAAAWGFKGQLKKLKDSAIMIKAVLSDAEQRQEGNEAVRLWLERLRSIVYDADDLFDEFSTMATRKELMPGSTPSKHVRLFFSNSNQAVFAFKMARQVKKIRGKLDAIEKDGNQFAFRLQGNDGQALSLGTRETPSSVDAEEVIGRDEDRKTIVEMLMLDPAVGENFSVLSIVGMGGLGKTTLAQLVFNDDRIKNHFEPKLWVCVGDVFDTKVVIANILMYATGNKPEGVGIDQLQSQLHGVIGGKKYLLVLDDVWNENREKWLDLANELKAGSKGSKILVTTRSKKVAEKSGNPTPYELKGLSEEMSWSLFERMAFEPGHSTDHLVEVGKEIVKKCANVPLAIKTLGCHLYGEEEGVWLSFREKELPKMPEGGDSIMAILKISYHHLPSALKNCFAYCCLFPKDYEMDKKTLIYLWMAEGFIIPSYEGQSLEDAGEMYFLTLLQRCELCSLNQGSLTETRELSFTSSIEPKHCANFCGSNQKTALSFTTRDSLGFEDFSCRGFAKMGRACYCCCCSQKKTSTHRKFSGGLSCAGPLAWLGKQQRLRPGLWSSEDSGFDEEMFTALQDECPNRICQNEDKRSPSVFDIPWLCVNEFLNPPLALMCPCSCSK
ncbi:hypothetical protein Dimus_017099 [Dionaea muscipula]